MTTVDARGLLCPLPLTMAKRRMAELRPGDTLLVMATDPEAAIDLAAWAGEAGHSFSRAAREGWAEYALAKGSAG
ncbi:MAG: sulfurtransferase TusA family protein [Thermoleophilaceae bacterium]|nr:sulfurtransferase TusA family protein [Thermoleophilaceae bacterium]